MTLYTLILPIAAAQDVETYWPATSAYEGTTGLQLEAPTVGWEGAVSGGLGLVYAHGQLVQVNADGSETPVLSDSFATHLSAAYTLVGRARIGVDLPLYPYAGGAAGHPDNGVSIGDLHLRGVVPLPLGLPVRLAVMPSIGLPTGETTVHLGAGGVSGGLGLVAGYTVISKLELTANLGFRAVPSSTLGDQPLGSAIDLGIGGAWPLREDLSVGLELDGAVDLAGGLSPWTDNPFELHAYGRYGKNAGIQALFGVGTGMVGGVGAPDVRVIAAVGYRLPGREPITDVDDDGIMDPVDACVDTPEDVDSFEDEDGCPELDNDRDQVPDTADACKSEPEDRDTFEDDDGCPDPDNDKDTVLDTEDKCPIVAGSPAAGGCPDRDADTVVDSEDQCPDDAGPPALFGCPDRDDDKVPDNRDKCPDEPIDPREDPARSDGCPKRVFLSMARIEILDKVYFETGKTTIKSQSFGLLAEVARLMTDNPDIARVEVSGHTDSVGNEGSNQKLSQGRALAVVKHLVTQNEVASSRLSAVGCGESVPVDTNATETGRANNRRVDFILKDSAPREPLGRAPLAEPPEVAPVVVPAVAPEVAPAVAPAWPPAVTPAVAPEVPPAVAPDPDDPFGLDE